MAYRREVKGVLASLSEGVTRLLERLGLLGVL